MMEEALHGLTLDDVKCLRVLSDGSALRHSYDVWFTRHGGRKVEKELVAKFNELAKDTELALYTANRFQKIVRQGLERLHDDGDSTLLDLCKTVIQAHGKFKPDEFVELLKIVMATIGALDNNVSNQTIREAASRLMPNTTIVEQLLKDT